ncbi:hypothetical protein [Nocardia rhizosphaerae]|uniref:Resolvase/invertase-type recombinase catalytic domain-containing protein n=1 Tax=Nocardia rhizosphaerae TaxID=1691571 RepID=A0ABV8LCM1_9NOCA
MTLRNFGFAGRVSTEDQQDPETSRNWQLARANALIEGHGRIVAEFFDIGQSRSIPWKRRPQASRLLELLRDPNRGFDAIVIGEPQRAFYGNQFGLTFPVFVHYGIEWIHPRRRWTTSQSQQSRRRKATTPSGHRSSRSSHREPDLPAVPGGRRDLLHRSATHRCRNPVPIGL